MKLLLWLKLTRERFIKRRSVSYMTFDIKQEYFTAAVDRNDLKTIRRLLDYKIIKRLEDCIILKVNYTAINLN